MSGIGNNNINGSTSLDDNAPVLNSNRISNDEQVDVKIDPITSLQDAIDGLSLAMFEALRGLRDAVAPESGSLQQQQQDSTLTDPTKNTNDTDALWMAYCNNEPDIVEQMNPYILEFLRKKKMKNSSANSGATGGSNMVGRNAKLLAATSADVIKKEQFVRLYTKMQYDKDSVLVQKLANDVLEKSKQIDIAVDDYVVRDDDPSGHSRVGCTIPGMHRTRSEQLRYIEQLIHDNQMASNELNTLHHVCIEQRDKCRQYVRQTTALALDVYEE